MNKIVKISKIKEVRTYGFPQCFGFYREEDLRQVRDCGVNVHCESCIQMSTWTKEDFKAFDRGVKIDEQNRKNRP